MPVEDKMFDDVPLGSNEPTPCSPEPPDPSFEGILINAPSRVSFEEGETVGRREAFARIPICGFYRLSPPSPPKYPTIQEGMVLVAVNTETGERYSGTLADPDPVAPPPDTEPPPADVLADIVVSGYFNPNLADYVPLPAEEAIYDVHVELDEMKSNVVRITVEEE